MHPFQRGDVGLNPATRRKLLERHPSLVLVVLFIIVTAFFTWREITQEFGFLIVRNQKAMAETQAVLSRVLAQQRAVMLSAGPILELRLVKSGLLSPDRDLDRSAIEAIFTDFIAQYPNISQLRWLDATGMERARIDQTGSAGGERKITSAGLLQDKSDRDYFRRSIDLEDGDFFISHLELNQEFGKIVFPIQPTLRIALPTRDTLNLKSGVLLLNFNLSGLLGNLSFPGQPGHTSVDMLDGVTGEVYASMSNPGLAWAHVLKDPAVYYGDIYPERFRRIREFVSSDQASAGSGNELIMMASPKMKVTDGTLVAYIFVPPEFTTAERHNILVKTAGTVVVAWLFGGLLLIRMFRMETRNIETMEEVQALAAAKSQFLANMSHEIRTPISGMMGMLDLLAPDIKEPAQKERLDFIRQCTRNLRRVIDDILDISKLQGGRVMLETKPFQPARTVEWAVKLYAIDAQLKGTELTATVPEALKKIVVEGDEYRISQVLNNLVSNAVKFTEQGHVSVEIQELMRSGLGVTLRFSVRDTGIGMASDTLEILGQPFVQADVSTTRSFGGTGLGLSICKSLLTLMSSEMKVESEPGRGSTFSFDLTLPLAESGTPEPEGPSVELPPGELSTGKTPTLSADQGEETYREVLMQQLARAVAEHGPPRVLVVEDSFAMQVLIREIFKSFSIPVQIADNGKLALECLEEQPFDLVFMDLQMPVMGGIEATEIIRQKYTSAQLPVIVLSAVTQAEEIARAMDAGGDKCLSKPIDIEKLLEILLDYWHPHPA
jgi:signal transduction histidine kinase